MNSTMQEDDKPKVKIAHSEVEKRRREKMNKYLFDLMLYMPQTSKESIGNAAKKLDKITILKKAVQHMKYLKTLNPAKKKSLKVIDESDLQKIIRDDNKGSFTIGLNCDTFTIAYASQSCYECIGYSQIDLNGKFFFDIVHTYDHKHVKDHINFSAFTNNQYEFNNYLLQKPTTGNRRMFVCRILVNPYIRQDHQSEYQVIQFTGIIKYEPKTSTVKDTGTHNRNNSSNDFTTFNDISSDSSNDFVSKTQSPYMMAKNEITQTINTSTTSLHQETSNNVVKIDKINYYLVLYGEMMQNTIQTQYEFTLKTEIDSTILYAEPQCFLSVGFLDHELVSNQYRDFLHPDDANIMRKAALESIKRRQKIKSEPYRFKRKDGEYVYLESTLYIIENPFTKQIEFVVNKAKLLQYSTIFDASTESSSPNFSEIQMQTIHESFRNDLVEPNNANLVTLSLGESNESTLMNSLTNNNFEINDYSNSVNFPITSINYEQPQANTSNDNSTTNFDEMEYLQRYNWMS